MDAMHQTGRSGLDSEETSCGFKRSLMEFLESGWDRSGRRNLGGPWESSAVYPY